MHDRRHVLSTAALAATGLAAGGDLMTTPAQTHARLETALTVLARRWDQQPVDISQQTLVAMAGSLQEISARVGTGPRLKTDLLRTRARVTVMRAQAGADLGQLGAAEAHARAAEGYAIRANDTATASLAVSVRAELAVARRDPDAERLIALAVGHNSRSPGAVLAYLADAQRLAAARAPGDTVLVAVRRAESAARAAPAGPAGFALDGMYGPAAAAFGGCALARAGAPGPATERLDAAEDQLADRDHGLQSACALYRAQARVAVGDWDGAHAQALAAIGIAGRRRTQWLSSGVSGLAGSARGAGLNWSDLVELAGAP